MLPSLNLVFDLQEDLLLRFGLGKTMARPRMDDMRAGADQPALEPISPASDETIGTWSAGGGGKPDLKPWRAKSVDLSLEKYFQKRSYVAVAGFLQETGHFHLRAHHRARLQRVPQLQPGPHARLRSDRSRIAIRTSARSPRRTMAAAARFTASKLAVSLDAGLFTPALEGFGVVLSESKTYNSLPDDENGDEIKLDGFSGTVNSIEAYFERGGFSARVSRRYRSAFTATTRSVLLNTQRSTQIDAESQIDAQIGYEFNAGTASGSHAAAAGEQPHQ